MSRPHWREWFDAHRVHDPDAPALGPALRPAEHELLAALRPATDELLAARTLLRRVDTKFVFPRRDLVELVQHLGEHFDLVRSGEALVGSYHNRYFDTDDRRFFHDHRRGVRSRHKVRIRRYLERGLGYVEVKTKDKYGLTTKTRRVHQRAEPVLSAEDEAFVRALVAGLSVCPSVHTDFPRMTLVGKDVAERLTLDLGLSLRSGRARLDLPDVVIGEIKQERYRARTPGMLAFRALCIRPQRISKYCVAMSLLEPGLPVHRFRRPLREIRRQHHA